MADGRRGNQNRIIGEIRERTISIHNRFADILPGIPARGALECHMIVEAKRLKGLLPLIIKTETAEVIPKAEIVAVQAALDRLDMLVNLLQLAVLDEPEQTGLPDEQAYVDRLKAVSRPELAKLLHGQAGLSLASDPAELMGMAALAPGLLAGLKEKLLKIIKLILLAIFLLFWYWKIVDITNFVKLLQKFIEWDEWGEAEEKPKDVAPPPAGVQPSAYSGSAGWYEGRFLAHMHLPHCEKHRVPETKEGKIYHIEITGGPYDPPPPVVEVSMEKNGPVHDTVREGEVKNIPCMPEIWLHLKYKPGRAVNVRIWTD